MQNKEKLKIPFVVKLCSDKAAFEVRIQSKTSFNMANLERILKSLKESEIIVNTPQILIFRSKGAEMTMSRNGRMLIKKSETKAMPPRLHMKFCLSRHARASHLRNQQRHRCARTNSDAKTMGNVIV